LPRHRLIRTDVESEMQFKVGPHNSSRSGVLVEIALRCKSETTARCFWETAAEESTASREFLLLSKGGRTWLALLFYCLASA
jgi:hypothetical protein